MATFAVCGADRSYGDAARIGDSSYGDVCGVERRGAAARVVRMATTTLRNDSDAMRCNVLERSLSADCTVSIAVPLVVSRTTKVVAGDRGNVGGGRSDKSPGKRNLLVTSDRVM